MQTLTSREITDAVELHRQWLNNEPNGVKANFSDCNLFNANFAGTDLRRALFNNANLSYLDLNHADLRGAQFYGAEMTEVNVNYANMAETNLVNVNLTSAKLQHTNLRHADFHRSTLKYADLESADLAFGEGLNSADLTGVYAYNANFVILGTDCRGHFYFAFADDDKIVNIYAGCRKFAGIDDAEQHWQFRHAHNAIFLADCLSLLERAKSMAQARGWKLNRSASWLLDQPVTNVTVDDNATWA